MARPRKEEALGASEFIGIRVPPELRQALDDIAERNQTSLADEVREALRQYVKRKAK